MLDKFIEATYTVTPDEDNQIEKLSHSLEDLPIETLAKLADGKLARGIRTPKINYGASFEKIGRALARNDMQKISLNFSKLIRKNPHMLTGAALGGAAGAVTSKDNPMGGAVSGALLGAGAGYGIPKLLKKPTLLERAGKHKAERAAAKELGNVAPTVSGSKLPKPSPVIPGEKANMGEVMKPGPSIHDPIKIEGMSPQELAALASAAPALGHVPGLTERTGAKLRQLKNSLSSTGDVAAPSVVKPHGNVIPPPPSPGMQSVSIPGAPRVPAGMTMPPVPTMGSIKPPKYMAPGTTVPAPPLNQFLHAA